MTQKKTESLNSVNTNTKEKSATSGSDLPKDQAREWLTYLYTADISLDKRQEFIDWIDHSKENREEFKRYQKIWQSIGVTDSAVDWLEQYTEKASGTPLKPSSKHWLLKSTVLFSGLAASIALLVINGLFITPKNNLETLNSEVVLTSPVGENRSFILTDGSKITLAGNSSVIVDINQHERRVSLRSGSAYFDVAHDISRVFSVTAQLTQVRVRGTAFEVKRSTDSKIKISVQRGLVDVADMPEHGSVDEHVFQLQANEQLHTDINGTFISDVIQFDPKTEFSWLNKRLIYDNVPLKNVIMDINRYAKKPVVIIDKSLNELPITASFTFDQIDQMLAGLSAAYSITLTEEDTRNILTK
jgi:transmembrane sensor